MQALGALQASFLANGQAMEAIKCCEAACELQSSRGDQDMEAQSRLALARLLLQHTNNLLAARKQLDRAVLLPRLLYRSRECLLAQSASAQPNSVCACVCGWAAWSASCSKWVCTLHKALVLWRRMQRSNTGQRGVAVLPYHVHTAVLPCSSKQLGLLTESSLIGYQLHLVASPARVLGQRAAAAGGSNGRRCGAALPRAERAGALPGAAGRAARAPYAGAGGRAVPRRAGQRLGVRHLVNKIITQGVRPGWYSICARGCAVPRRAGQRLGVRRCSLLEDKFVAHGHPFCEA